MAETVPPGLADWQPVFARGLPGEESIDTSEIERCASELGLPSLRLPPDFPFDSERAMLVATWAKSIGRGVPFAQAAFRQAFAAGRTLADMDTVLIAAAACEMHPTAVFKGAELGSVRERLTAATAAAAELGVTDVPALRLGEQVFVGRAALDQPALR